MNVSNKEHIAALDGLRGLAAMEVVLLHFFTVFPAMAAADRFVGGLPVWVNLLAYTPLHIFLAGHEAVILFFTLSGFVLALPYAEDRSLPYWAYLIRRFCRIYIPFFVLISVSVFLLKLSVFEKDIPWISLWLKALWTLNITWKQILNIYGMVGDIFTYRLAPTTWSLVHELRISIFFPVLAVMIIKRDWKKGIVLGLMLEILAAFFKNTGAFFEGDLYETFFYTSFFIYGILLAQNREKIKAGFSKMNLSLKTIGSLVALVLYIWNWFPGVYFRDRIPWAFSEMVCDTMTGIASAFWIILALQISLKSSSLVQKIILWLGKISYSLYLTHALVLNLAIYFFHHFLPVIFSDLIGLGLSFGFAYLFYRWVEVPSIRLGKNITRKYSKHRKNS